MTLLTLPANTKEIANRAFFGTDAEIVIIPDGCEKIDLYAFANCDNLIRIYIPDSVTTFGSNIFFSTNGVTICTPSGSPAEAYAESCGIPVSNAY